MSTQYLLLVVFGICLYVVITDSNVAKAFNYIFELASTNIRKKWWWMTNDPSNPVVKYFLYRKNLKLAEELRAKIDNFYEENK
tara:strand:+ start:24 stop:272 length:249 start_codon:yes stop_codon:yes gene_type:complete